MHIEFWWESQKERKKPLETCRRRWENNIKMDLRETGWGNID
jgi:hypothetical protein